jgi:hypothetical protein
LLDGVLIHQQQQQQQPPQPPQQKRERGGGGRSSKPNSTLSVLSLSRSFSLSLALSLSLSLWKNREKRKKRENKEKFYFLMCVSMCDKACESDNNFMFLINIKIYIFERRNGPKEVSLDRENISCPTLQTVLLL